MSSNNSLATRGQAAPAASAAETGIKKLIQTPKVHEQLMAALPRYYTPEQFVVIVRTAINKNPKLEECTPESFMVAMLTAAQMGIPTDGRHGHLIPRYNGRTGKVEAQFQPDYKGLVALIRRNNDNVADVYAELVYSNDHIVVTKGLKRDLIHECDVRAERGELIGVYAVITYKDDTAASFEYLSRADVEKVRARSDSWKAHVAKGFDTPWLTDEGEMWKKTALKRLFKLADLSEDTTDRLAHDPEMKRAEAVEIKPASIPGAPEPVGLPAGEAEAQPALPEPAPAAKATPVVEGELVNDPAPAAAKVAKPAPAKAEKPAPAKPAPAAAAPARTETRSIEDEVVEAGKKAPLKPAAKPTPPPADTPEAKAIAQVRAALERDGFTEPQLIEVCVANEWGRGFREFNPQETRLEAVDLETLESFLEETNWAEVVTPELELVKKGA